MPFGQDGAMIGDTDLLGVGGIKGGEDHPALYDAARAVDEEIVDARRLGFAAKGITNGRHIDGAALGQVDAVIVAPDTPARAGRIPGAIGHGIGVLEGDGPLGRDESIERLIWRGRMREIGVEIPPKEDGGGAGGARFHLLHEVHERVCLLQTLCCPTGGTYMRVIHVDGSHGRDLQPRHQHAAGHRNGMPLELQLGGRGQQAPEAGRDGAAAERGIENR